MEVMVLSLKINKCVTSDLNNIKIFLDELLNKINTVITDKSNIFAIKVILNELVVNGVIHGNLKDKNKLINVCVCVDPNVIKIEVKDEGEGIVYNKEEYNPMELKCGGRGLIIVEGLSDEFYIEKNKVTCIKYLYNSNKG
jgi:serine/threonine-protein kinase RsbW